MGSIGIPEIAGLGILALLIFGPKRPPEVGNWLGKGIREFKSSVEGLNSEAIDQAVAAPEPASMRS
jgi:sec-independent protein translocase protein TatA